MAEITGCEPDLDGRQVLCLCNLHNKFARSNLVSLFSSAYERHWLDGPGAFLCTDEQMLAHVGIFQNVVVPDLKYWRQGIVT